MIPGGSLRASIHDSSRLTDNFANGMCPWLFLNRIHRRLFFANGTLLLAFCERHVLPAFCERHVPPAFCKRHAPPAFCERHVLLVFLRTARSG